MARSRGHAERALVRRVLCRRAMETKPFCVMVLDVALWSAGVGASVAAISIGGVRWLWVAFLGAYVSAVSSTPAAWWLARHLGWVDVQSNGRTP